MGYTAKDEGIIYIDPEMFQQITLTVHAGRIPGRKGMETGHEKNIGIIIRGDGKGF